MPFRPDYDVPPERRPYTLNGGRVGVLMLHGFMGSPLSSRALAGYLGERGITVHCPLLPGHGHWPDKLHRVPAAAWQAEAEEALTRLRALADEIFVMGHSMGNVLAAHLAIAHDDVQGFVLLAPIYDVPDRRLRLMRLLRYVMPWLYPWRIGSMRPLVRERVLDFDPTFDFDAPDAAALLAARTRLPTGALDEMRRVVDAGRRLWPRVRVPALVLDGGHDIAVSDGSGARIVAALGSADKAHHHIAAASHELMRPKDPAHPEVWEAVYRFVRERSGLASAVRPGSREAP